MVGDRQRGLAQLLGALDERPDAACAVEQAVFTMYVQVCKPHRAFLSVVHVKFHEFFQPVVQAALRHRRIRERGEVGQAGLGIGNAQQRRALQLFRQHVEPVVALDAADGVDLLLRRGDDLVGVGGVAVDLAVDGVVHGLLHLGGHDVHGGAGRADLGQEVLDGLGLLEIEHGVRATVDAARGKAQLREQGGRLAADARVRRDELEVVVLARGGHAAAREKRPPQERRLAAVVFEHGEVDVVRDRAREVGAEGGEHRLDGGAVGDGQHVAAAGLFPGRQGKVRAERAAKQLRQPLGKGVARRDDADLPRRERVAVQQHAVGLGHGAAVAADRHAAQLVFHFGCKGHGAPPSGLGKVPVAQADVGVARGEVVRQYLGHGHAAVLPARAADADRKRIAPLGGVLRQEKIDHVGELGEEIFRHVAAQDVFLHLGVHAAHGAELFDVKRVRQKAHVEHEVGVDRDAVLEAEGHDVDENVAPRAAVGKILADALLQHGEREARRVDDEVCALAHGGEQLALAAHGLGQGAAALGLQRVRPARLLVAAHDGAFRRLNEQNAVVHAHAPKLPERGKQLGKALLTADVRHERDLFIPSARGKAQLGKLRQQCRGHIVHAVKVQILQHVGRAALAAAGQARYDQKFHPVTPG